MDMWYGMPSGEQYRKEETGKENQLQAACIQNRREDLDSNLKLCR